MRSSAALSLPSLLLKFFLSAPDCRSTGFVLLRRAATPGTPSAWGGGEAPSRSSAARSARRRSPLTVATAAAEEGPSSSAAAIGDEWDRAMEEAASKQKSSAVFLISDSTGVTLKAVLQKSLAQFQACGGEETASWGRNAVPPCEGDEEEGDVGGCEVQTRMFNFVRSEAAVAAIVKKASERGAMIMYTMADPVLSQQTSRMCELSGVPATDLLGPTLNQLSDLLGRAPAGVPGLANRHAALQDSYFRRIEAVEFTLKADDGRSPWLLKDADAVIVGVSRTGKTPLSVVLSQTMGLRVANVPLVLECPPPKELLDSEPGGVDPKRVFCLTINPNELKRIRTTRLERRNVKEMEEKFDKSLTGEGERRSNYADRNYLLRDLKSARALAVSNGWTEIDVTGRAVEETASLISEILNERFMGDTAPLY
eukprot:CAMPEP_0183295336 /NCGR_PEP_ID=MMETSP0160_2-20130417/3333_1 /TAXON_ID=2839 ORGANISM="Odontella Sinensis, Strain Grunow 1884" /NCGR_SAMPLE_ID=MMETSP0160_2 /ASSEMBLY_ACC=CAM_ASM_000250 /LENGTH=424 /DNA_ID=CAMNT_0025456805 /DNA_START=154 /DNA_END=1428 /DNA_ORIENTATION=+